MRSERRPRRSTRRPEALASRQHAILALDHCGPMDKPLECPALDHRPDPLGKPLSVMTGEVGDAARHEVDSYPCAFGLRKNRQLERGLRETGLSVSGSNRRIQHSPVQGRMGVGIWSFRKLCLGRNRRAHSERDQRNARKLSVADVESKRYGPLG